MKQVVAVAPYNHGINFKMQAYDAWVKIRALKEHSIDVIGLGEEEQ